MERSYTVSELRKLVQESTNEFKAKMGNEVEKENKKNNIDKAESEKIIKTHYGKKMEAPKLAPYKKEDGNKTTTDFRTDFEVGDDYKKKVESQAKGYTSPDEEKNGIDKEESATFSDKTYKAIKDCGKKMQDNSDTVALYGIKGKNMDDETKEAIRYPGIYDKKSKDDKTKNEGKNIKTIYFKKTSFLTEGHMISRIPDEFKNEGCKFRMKDRDDNTYLIEWSDNKPYILEHENKKGLDESLSRMKALMGYSSSEYVKGANGSERLNESNEGFTNTLNNARKMNV